MDMEKLETELKISGKSSKTIDTYLFFNRKFLQFIQKTPEYITTDDIKKYQAFLMVDRKLSINRVNLALSSLKFFYDKVLNKNIFERIDRPRKEKKIPIVLTRDELDRLISAASTQKSRVIIKLLYSAGLRVSECACLRLNDIEFEEKKGG